MVEEATALKKVCGMNRGRKHKKQYERKQQFFLGWISSGIGSS
jgi:hypothetical protein